MEDTVETQRIHRSDHVLYTCSEGSSRASSVYSHAPSSSEESFVLPQHDGYESPVPHDDLALERKHEMRYRMLLDHDFHPSCRLHFVKIDQLTDCH